MEIDPDWTMRDGLGLKLTAHLRDMIERLETGAISARELRLCAEALNEVCFPWLKPDARESVRDTLAAISSICED